MFFLPLDKSKPSRLARHILLKNQIQYLLDVTPNLIPSGLSTMDLLAARQKVAVQSKQATILKSTIVLKKFKY
jgi:hypothetical protein